MTENILGAMSVHSTYKQQHTNSAFAPINILEAYRLCSEDIPNKIPYKTRTSDVSCFRLLKCHLL